MPIALQQRPQRPPLLAGPDRLPSSEFLANDPVKKTLRVEKPPKRQLRFNSVVSVRPSLHVNDYTDEEFGDCWYNKEDFDEMKKRMVPILRAVKQGMELPDFVTFRGLEYRLKSGAAARKANKVAGTNAVLGEQARQRALGICDDESIRAAYLKIGQPCLYNAQIMGKKDEAEALPNTTAKDKKTNVRRGGN